MNKSTKNLGLPVGDVKTYTFWDEGFPFVLLGLIVVLGTSLWGLISG